MKKIIIVLTVLTAFVIKVNAQIPNGGFEIWENYYDGPNVYQKPDLWCGLLPFSNQTHSFSITKNLESYPPGTGQYSMKVQPDLPNGVRGLAISNDEFDPMVNWLPKPSFPIDFRPESLYLYYKYLPYGGDSLIIQVYFYKEGEIIANSMFIQEETVSEWTPLEIPMSFPTQEVPDSATIYFVTGAFIQHSESVLFLDNLSFAGFVTSIQDENPGNFTIKIYPNPTSGLINIDLGKHLSNFKIIVTDLSGRLIGEFKYDYARKVSFNLDAQPGVYMLNLQTNDQKTNKVVIRL